MELSLSLYIYAWGLKKSSYKVLFNHWININYVSILLESSTDVMCFSRNWCIVSPLVVFRNKNYFYIYLYVWAWIVSCTQNKIISKLNYKCILRTANDRSYTPVLLKCSVKFISMLFTNWVTSLETQSECRQKKT